MTISFVYRFYVLDVNWYDIECIMYVRMHFILFFLNLLSLYYCSSKPRRVRFSRYVCMENFHRRPMVIIYLMYSMKFRPFANNDGLPLPNLTHFKQVNWQMLMIWRALYTHTVGPLAYLAQREQIWLLLKIVIVDPHLINNNRLNLIRNVIDILSILSNIILCVHKKILIW